MKSRDDATKFFRDMGEEYKAQIIERIPANEELSLYTQGEFTDLCRGPHVPGTDKLRAFKLMKVAGAYWRGDSRNEMLQRIYGTAWGDEKSLKAYLTRLEEAEKRDHRKIGKEQDLFHFQEEAPGAVFWHPKGWTLFQTLIAYMRQYQGRAGWQEVSGPEVMDVKLWDASGHLATFAENMYFTEVEKRKFCLKPMNCPGHVQIFNSDLRSYRDLPLRYGEFGQCHRNEPSGALHGIMRVRGFTQDDGHAFVTEDQILDECVAYTTKLQEVYRDFGFTDILYKVATRPENRVGSDELWDKAEHAVMEALRRSGVDFVVSPGDGAFYGPKIEYTLKDALGRQWQCGTMQVNFNTAERLGAEYVTETSGRAHPVMLHRAMFGLCSASRAFCIEQFRRASCRPGSRRCRPW